MGPDMRQRIMINMKNKNMTESHHLTDLVLSVLRASSPLILTATQAG